LCVRVISYFNNSDPLEILILPLEIRENTNKSWVLGSEKFIKQIEDQLKIQAKPKPRGGNQKQKKPES